MEALCDDVLGHIRRFVYLSPARYSAVAWRHRLAFRSKVLSLISIHHSPFVVRYYGLRGDEETSFVFVRSMTNVRATMGDAGVKWFHLYLRHIVP
jgi:hypothetical protein